jgi:hypothetical protein
VQSRLYWADTKIKLEDDLCFGMLRRAVWQKFADVSEVLTASIIRVMMTEVVSTS